MRHRRPCQALLRPLLLLLLLLGVAQPQPAPDSADDRAAVKARLAQGCSRADSRDARAVLELMFYGKLEEANYNVSNSCPFSRVTDLYLEHERNKYTVRRNQWKSNYSDKLFR